jgi:hypothetical protein
VTTHNAEREAQANDQGVPYNGIPKNDYRRMAVVNVSVDLLIDYDMIRREACDGNDPELVTMTDILSMLREWAIQELSVSSGDFTYSFGGKKLELPGWIGNRERQALNNDRKIQELVDQILDRH